MTKIRFTNNNNAFHQVSACFYKVFYPFLIKKNNSLMKLKTQYGAYKSKILPENL